VGYESCRLADFYLRSAEYRIFDGGLTLGRLGSAAKSYPTNRIDGAPSGVTQLATPTCLTTGRAPFTANYKERSVPIPPDENAMWIDAAPAKPFIGVTRAVSTLNRGVETGTKRSNTDRTKRDSTD
jgi:hypothetical protein